jgi:hypothetical protein
VTYLYFLSVLKLRKHADDDNLHLKTMTRMTPYLMGLIVHLKRSHGTKQMLNNKEARERERERMSLVPNTIYNTHTHMLSAKKKWSTLVSIHLAGSDS